MYDLLDCLCPNSWEPRSLLESIVGGLVATFNEGQKQKKVFNNLRKQYLRTV